MWPSMQTWLGLLGGVAVGYAYYALIGCRTGTCLISSNPWLSSGYFGFLGWLLAGGGGWLGGLVARIVR
ncbi:MAG: hypothetical protein JRI25_10285 [Deltaproteobacteria bacterium]|nr:hypothetical protein [Deltaproteobacteria bacterium]